MKTRRALALMVSAAVVALAACTSGGAEGVDTVGAPGNQEQPSADGDQGVPSALEDGCAAARTLRILHAPGPLDDESQDSPVVQDEEPLLAAVRAVLPDKLAEQWDWFMALTEEAYDDPDLVTEEIEAEAFDAFESIVGSLGEACADEGPFWGCAAQDETFPTVSKFSTVDDIDDPSTPAGPAQGTEPRALAEEIEQPGDLVLLSDDGAQMYAWLDEVGLVVRSLEVVPVEGGWSRGTDTRCLDLEELAASAEEKFETVGEAIESSDGAAPEGGRTEGMIKSPDDGEWVVPFETLTSPGGNPYTYDQDGYQLSMDECHWYSDAGNGQLDEWCEEHIFS